MVVVFFVISLSYTAIPYNAAAGEIVKIPSHYGRINVRNEPSYIFGGIIKQIHANYYWFAVDSIRNNMRFVELTGRKKFGWVEIKHPIDYAYQKLKKNNFFYQQVTGWILGDFFGLNQDIEYKAFEKSVKSVVIVDNVLARLQPMISSRYHVHFSCGKDTWSTCTFNKDTVLTIIGRQGNWLKIAEVNGKKHFTLWVYHELVFPQN